MEKNKLLGPHAGRGKEAKTCGHLVSKDRHLWIIIAQFFSFNDGKKTSKAIDSFDITSCVVYSVAVLHVAVVQWEHLLFSVIAAVGMNRPELTSGGKEQLFSP